MEAFEPALKDARLPQPVIVAGTVSGINLHIGSDTVDSEQAITIPIKYSKATMKARPPTLSKAWKAAVELQAPLTQRDSTQGDRPSQLAHSVAEQSQLPEQSDVAALVSADVKNYTAYVIRRLAEKDGGQPPTQGTQGTQGAQDPGSQVDPTQAEPEEEEEPVAQEDIVKAYRYGSTWVPVEEDIFTPLDTAKGVEILSFFPRSAVRRHLLMGEVRFVWPDMTSPKAQIAFGSLVDAMYLRDVVAIVRWVLKNNGDPVIGLCIPMVDNPGEEGQEMRLNYMYWVRVRRL